ncbi:MAG: hypothetical protein IKO61_08775 [Lachnospiraceae bacterium]|nr:hypothetical protein [Lachnospiraceae bacterium]
MGEDQRQRDRAALEELASQSEIAIANRAATWAVTVINLVIIAAYILEVVKGNRTVGYVAIAVALALLPIVSSWFFYMKDEESEIVKHTVASGFSLMYMYVLFTASNPLVFTYVIPLMVIVTLYSNQKYQTIIGVSAAGVNIIDVIRQAMNNPDSSQVVTMEIQGLLMVLIAAYFVLSSVKSAQYDKIRRARLLVEQGKTEQILMDVLDVSGKMTDTVSNVSNEMESLRRSVESTVQSMNEVNLGTSESSDAIQGQLMMTEQIQEHIKLVEEVSQTLNQRVQTTFDAVEAGRQNINRMDNLTDQVDTAGKDVATAIHTFKDKASQMNNITEMIQSVASQTSLLALNASIEAARAGEAGRGFSVVATEISNLSGQTTDATNDINRLIQDITSQIDTMVATIEHLIKVGEDESRCAEETAKSFGVISENVDDIHNQSNTLDELVDKLAKSNEEIMRSIETISAMTEEVTAHATETLNISENNQDIVTHINELVEDLNNDAEELKSHTD